MTVPFSERAHCALLFVIWIWRRKGGIHLTLDTITGWGMQLSSSGWWTQKSRKKEPLILNPERSKPSKSFLLIPWSELTTQLYPNARQPGKCSHSLDEWQLVILDDCSYIPMKSSCPIFLGKCAHAFFDPEDTLREVLIPYSAVRNERLRAWEFH